MKKLLLLIASFVCIPTAYALPQCPADTQARWHNCQGIKIFEKNAYEYEGEWRDGKMHGQGTFTYGPKSHVPGHKYVGEYRDGKQRGQGTYTWSDGDK